MSYYTKITKAGLAAITAAMNNNSKVPITYMAFGDGNGYIPEPDENATSLVNEVYRVGVNKVEVHNKNPNWLVCEAIIPSAVGGFNIREVALYDSTGNTMLAIASYPPTYKPTVEEGAAKIQTIRIVIQVDNTGNFELIIDPDIVLATIEYINENLTAEKVKTGKGRNLEQKTQEFISVHDYCNCDGTDETNQFKAAIDEARATGRELKAFSGTILLSSDCNLREVTFDLTALSINLIDNAKLIVGWNAGNSLSKKQHLGLVKKTGSFSLNPSTLNSPSVRLMGSKCLDFKFSQIDYLQLYASTDPSTYPKDASIAYCTTTGTLVTRLEFATDPRYADGAEVDGAGTSNQWVNSNYFYIARAVAIDIGGSYSHNGNIFYNCTVETNAARINIQRGNKNRFVNMRLENNPTITFGEQTLGNIVERIWFGSQANYLTYSNVTDNGLLNKVTNVHESKVHKIDIIRLDARVDTQHNGQSGNYGNLSPSRKFIKPNGNSRIIYETKPFLIDPSDTLDFYCDNPTTLDNSTYIARIYFYDANMQPCENITASWYTSGNFTTITSGYVIGSFNSSGRAYLALEKLGRDNVKYMSVMLLGSSNISNSVSSQVNVSLITMRNIIDINKTNVSKVDQMQYVTSKPTAFIGKMGDVVQGLDASYRCRLMINTTLTAAASVESTVVSVGNLSGGTGIGTALAGDMIGIELDNHSTHWTTIESNSGLNVTISTGLPSAASAGNNIYISRLV